MGFLHESWILANLQSSAAPPPWCLCKVFQPQHVCCSSAARVSLRLWNLCGPSGFALRFGPNFRVVGVRAFCLVTLYPQCIYIYHIYISYITLYDHITLLVVYSYGGCKICKLLGTNELAVQRLQTEVEDLMQHNQSQPTQIGSRCLEVFVWK